jgi:hypothetical protein
MTAETPAGTETPAEIADTPAGTADTLAETADMLAGRKGKASQVKLIVGVAIASILALLAAFVTGALVGAVVRKRWDKFSHGY